MYPMHLLDDVILKFAPLQFLVERIFSIKKIIDHSIRQSRQLINRNAFRDVDVGENLSPVFLNSFKCGLIPSRDMKQLIFSNFPSKFNLPDRNKWPSFLRVETVLTSDLDAF